MKPIGYIRIAKKVHVTISAKNEPIDSGRSSGKNPVSGNVLIRGRPLHPLNPKLTGSIRAAESGGKNMFSEFQRQRIHRRCLSISTSKASIPKQLLAFLAG
jgi:hypothetical protein